MHLYPNRWTKYKLQFKIPDKTGFMSIQQILDNPGIKQQILDWLNCYYYVLEVNLNNPSVDKSSVIIEATVENNFNNVFNFTTKDMSHSVIFDLEEE